MKRKKHKFTKETRAEVRIAGSIGGLAGKGTAKARTSEQARAAVNARWERYRAAAKAAQSEVVRLASR